MPDAHRAVEIVPYDPAWPAEFEALAARARAVLGDSIVVIEHVGSTSVPGLAAKPVIDLDAVLHVADRLGAAIERLAPLGYVWLGERTVHGRHFFAHPPAEKRHHLCVCTPDSRGLRDHLRFRDALRRDAALADRYAALKRQLAARFPTDPDAYCEAKSDFVLTTLAVLAAAPPPGATIS